MVSVVRIPSEAFDSLRVECSKHGRDGSPHYLPLIGHPLPHHVSNTSLPRVFSMLSIPGSP